MKKILAILLILCLILSLTGCVATRNAATLNEDEVDRPSVVVTSGETELSATVETTDAETGADTTEIINNPVEAGATITLSGKHSSGIKAITYRFVLGEGETAEKTAVSVNDGDKLDVEIPANASSIEVYVTNGNGIVSKWATYYFA